MKAHVIGIEISEGVSKKTGNAYAIGKLYTALPIVGKGARGLMCWRRFKIEPPCRLNFEPGLMANL